MMAPLPSPTPPPDRPELPRVRLEVRTGSGRMVSYEVGSEEFLIGGASGCDLRLPAPSLPPVVCQLTRKADGVRVRRLAAGLSVLLNDAPLANNVATPLSHNDRLTVAGIEIAVAIQVQSFLVPRLVPLDPHAANAEDGRTPPAPSNATNLPDEVFRLESLNRNLQREIAAYREEWHRREAALAHRQQLLDQQVEEVEAERALWQQRREELEQQAEQLRTSLTPELAAREQELNRVHNELVAFRENLTREYHDRRDQILQAQEQIREANARLQQERAAFEADQQRRRGELAAELERHRRNLEEEAAERRAQLEEEFRNQRQAFTAEMAERAVGTEVGALDRYRSKLEELDRLQESLRESSVKLTERREQFEVELEERRRRVEADAAKKLQQADEEVARRRAAFEAEIAAYQPKLTELADKEVRLAATAHSLERERDAMTTDQEILARSRETFEVQRTAEGERLAAWEKAIADREAALARREEAIRADREAADRDRQLIKDDLFRLDRYRAEAEERERSLEAKTREALVRLEQIKRDAAEWEETVHAVAGEQDRLRAEGERLDRQKAELDSQTSRLAERAAHLEAQQSTLAVLRAKLDRAREEMEREAAALAAARVREEEAQAELRARIGEAEQLRAELSTVQENTAQERRRLEERDSLLTAGLEEIRQQKETLAVELARVQQREAEIDSRTSEFAEQAGALKGRMAQAVELQARLEADRIAIREREAALAQAEEARQTLQEQLRRRAEDLAERSKSLDEMARRLAADRSTIDRARTAAETERIGAEERVAALQEEVEARALEVGRQSQTLAEREAAMVRQVARLKEVGQAVAAERKALADARTKWAAEKAEAEAETRKARQELEAFRSRAASDMASLRAQAPELEDQAKAALLKLNAAKETLRGHLVELNDFARRSREDLEAVRAQVRVEAERIRAEETALDRARAEHRLAVATFRQQLVDWQGKVAEMKRGLAQSESRLEAKQAAVDQAARQVDATSQQLAQQAEQLRQEREEVVQKRTEVERHLADMREWYRKKLRELAESRNAELGTQVAKADSPLPFNKPRLAAIHDPDDSKSGLSLSPSALEELDPGDRQLGELLRSLELVDPDSLAALWAEAGRQRRTLRQVLLASGTITLYQLALIEAGNLDGLMLGRFRVIDRLRVTPREAIYRVLDPTRAEGKSGGVLLLRHLSEAEMQDAVHPDEFRQRFAAARDAAHPNLAGVVEVAEVNGRPAVLQEWLTGLFSTDWPNHAAHPGCWVRLATMAAEGIDAAHRAGLVHGRLTSDSFVLTAGGSLKVTGFGEPPWLGVGPVPAHEPTTAADLRAFGQVVFGWSQLGAKKRGSRATGKAFPMGLVAVVRRLEAAPESPMADTVAADRPYTSTAELVSDLKRIARDTSFSDDAWDKLLRHVAENAPDGPAVLRQSA